ncbi:MAG: thiamine-phosphate kinase [Candidatus Bathyarchaeota archaeon]|nr:thiamine-phosphate kinase [Candidatus Bathyarchaeota archaeon]
MLKKNKLTERKIIGIIIKLQDKMKNNPLPFGDDVAAIRIGRGQLAVMKCDMLVAKTDIPEGMNLWQTSRKAVVSVISDLAAKGVQPMGILISLGLPREISENYVRQIGRGMNAAAREYGTHVIGGDTNESTDLTIDVSAFGICEERKLVRRDTAKVGDIVMVTGTFGLPALGLKIIKKNMVISRKLKAKAIKAVYMPKARLSEGLTLAKNHLINSSIDSSDGLAWSLSELSKSSNVGFQINKIPIHREVREFAIKNNLDPFELAFYGGEEYELVVTQKPALYKKTKKKIRTLIPIGHVTENSGKIILKLKNKYRDIDQRGYEHHSNNI